MCCSQDNTACCSQDNILRRHKSSEGASSSRRPFWPTADALGARKQTTTIHQQQRATVNTTGLLAARVVWVPSEQAAARLGELIRDGQRSGEIARHGGNNKKQGVTMTHPPKRLPEVLASEVTR